eukprot:scaffold6939_cov28-Tisochrysis_lutea.AAC.3
MKGSRRSNTSSPIEGLPRMRPQCRGVHGGRRQGTWRCSTCPSSPAGPTESVVTWQAATVNADPRAPAEKACRHGCARIPASPRGLGALHNIDGPLPAGTHSGPTAAFEGECSPEPARPSQPWRLTRIPPGRRGWQRALADDGRVHISSAETARLASMPECWQGFLTSAKAAMESKSSSSAASSLPRAAIREALCESVPEAFDPCRIAKTCDDFPYSSGAR